MLSLYLRRQLKNRVMILATGKVKVTHLRDGEGICKGFGNFMEELSHLISILEIKLPSIIAQPLFITELSTCLNTKERFVRGPVLSFYVVDIIAANNFD